MKSDRFAVWRARSTIAALVLLLGMPEYGAAMPMNPINNLQYWLVKPPQGIASDWQARDVVHSNIDDNGTGHSGYLGPGFGGQRYDAEAIYVELTEDFINIAVVTGMRPGNPQTVPFSFAPGDITLDFGYIDGTPSFEVGIVTTDRDGVTAGDVYRVKDTDTGWEYGIFDDGGSYKGHTYPQYEAGFKKNEHPTIVLDTRNRLGSVDAGTVDFFYGNAMYGSTDYTKDGNILGDLDKGGDKHYLIAASLSLDILPDDLFDKNNPQPFWAHWTMRCANDYVQVDPPPPTVPEPSTLLLILGSLLSLAGFRHFRKLIVSRKCG